MNSHPDRKTLDRLSVGDLPSPTLAEVEQHVGACPVCQSYVEALERERRARLAEVPPELFLAAVEARRQAARQARRRTFSRWGAVVGGLVPAAAVLLFLLRPAAPPPENTRGGVSLKGGGAPGVIVHRKRGDEVVVLRESGRLRPGDALRVELSLSARQRIRAWMEGPAERLELTTPASGQVFEAGTQVLPGSAVVVAPCEPLMLIVESDGPPLRRRLACE